VWRSVRVPRVEAEDRRHRHRALAATTPDRTRVSNRLTGRRASQGLVLSPGRDCPPHREALRLWDASPLPAGLRHRLSQAWEHVQALTQRMARFEAERRAVLQTAADAATNNGPPLRLRNGLGMTSAGGLVLECCGWRAVRHRKAGGALSRLTPPPSMSGNAADERGIAKAGQDDIRARAIEIAWGWRRCQPARALTRWSQQRLGPGSSRLRRIGMVALARQLRMALWRLVETGVGPAGAALKAAVGLSPHPGSTSCEAVRRWAAREETGFAVRTDLAKGRPTTARSRRDERMLDQVFGGKRPTRREGGLRRMRLTPPRARGTVAARRDARNSLTSTATSKGSSSPEVVFPSPSLPRGLRRRGP
jgi:transposase